MRPSSIIFALLCALISLSTANLMGVDLGLGYIKVAVARPGKGLELVTNEQSKRKTPAAVGFTQEGERLFGDAAVAYAAKDPSRAILDGRSFIGECSSEHTSSTNPYGHPLCDRGRLHVDGVGHLTGEEIVAMLLAMAKRQASAALDGAPIKDVAVTVPVWYDERQRQAVFDAARVIGLNCLGVVNANTAAALKYAIDGKAKPTEQAIAAEKEKDKKKRAPKTISQRVLFYDMGASGASASLAEITSDVKTGIANNVKMLSHAWDQGIGGRLLDSVIVDRLADSFDTQRGSGAKPSREIPRVMARLRKEAQRVREVLSANMDTIVSVASLYDDLDLKTTLKRADFENDAKHMLELTAGPVKSVLSEAGLTGADLDAVVPFGGASRTPKVQEIIRDTLGLESLNKSINTDEAAVMGSAFFGASLSSTFRVRKLDFEDTYSRAISAEIEKEGKSSGLFSGNSKPSVQTVQLFSSGSARMPAKKTLSLNRKNDFAIQVYLESDKAGKVRFPDRTLYSTIKINGVSDVLKKLKDSSKAKTLTPRVAITIHIDRSGAIRVGTAESSVDETVVVEKEVPIVEEKQNKTEESKSSKDDQDGKSGKTDDKTEPSTESKSESTSEEDKPASGEDGKTADNNENNEKKKTSNNKQKKKTKTEKSTQTIVHRQTLKIEYEENSGLLGMRMSGKELEAAKKVLKDLETADKERVERADALNSLEGFILEVRSLVRGLDEDDDLFKVSTSDEREALVRAFDEGEDWMYTDEAKQTSNLKKKHQELKKLFQPMSWRAQELSLRPQALKSIGDAVNVGLKEASRLRELHVERKSKHIKDFEEFIDFSNSLKTWLDEKEAEQAKQELTEAPVVTLKELKTKGLELKEKIRKIASLEPPPAPSTSPDGESKKGDEQPDDTANSTKSESSEGKSDGEGDSASVPEDPNPETAKADAASGTAKDEL